MMQKKLKIVSNRSVAPGYFKLTVACPEITRRAQPGQFVMVRVSDGITPLLRRPFGVHRVDGGKMEILYQVVGKGTQVLAGKKAGEVLDIVGPLGNGFAYSAPVPQYPSVPVLVAGGMGVAPLFFLAQRLSKIEDRRWKGETKILLGAKTREHIFCEEEFKQLGCEVRVATDDGSRGFKGKVTELLKDWFRRTKDEACLPDRQGRRTIYACGPRPMLKAIQQICRQKNIPGQASLEEHLACGIGACMGCAVETNDGFKRVCKEGPVFDIAKVIF